MHVELLMERPCIDLAEPLGEHRLQFSLAELVQAQEHDSLLFALLPLNIKVDLLQQILQSLSLPDAQSPDNLSVGKAVAFHQRHDSINSLHFRLLFTSCLP